MTSMHVNLATHGQELAEAYRAVLSDSDPTNWLIFSYDKGTSDLKVQGTGDGGLEELNEEFNDAKMQFAYARVIDPNTELPKFVFIAWCGSGVPETRKVFFNSHLNDVSNFFKSFHVQINARDEADVEPELIMKRVSESSGAKYSFHKEKPRPMPAVTPVGSVYKKTEVPDIAAMQRESMKKEGPPAPVGTNYKPVQTAPKPLASRWQPQQTEDKAAAVRAEREKAEREAREREEAAARQRTAAMKQQQDDEEEQRRQQQLREEQERAEAERRAAAEAEAARQRQLEQERREAEERERAAAAAAAAAEEDRKRQQQLQQQREEEERQRQAAAEAQRQREIQEQEEKRRLEEEEKERQRQQQAVKMERQQAALQSQLDQTADRAVETATHAADTAVTGAHGARGLSAVVLFGYDAAEANEMTLVEGEVIVQIDQVDEGWWFGVSEDGKKEGLFPSNYVQVLEEETAPVAAGGKQEDHHVQQPSTTTTTHQSPPPKQDLGQTAVALYDYDAGEDNEISFRENDVITHIEFVSEDWWQGVAADGKTVGLFPANYVELQQH
ncbi:hypothetical protein VTP01DRAFT_10353 [Rhizomucor pusillus]|uniref:uncharacterized protein n=1 Tax=Rhizomucor pusillus TaxID=4840 RepID=UPI003743A10C